MDYWENIAIVSPELHQRPYLKFWGQILEQIENNNRKFFLEKLMICTDYPLKFYNLITKVNHD